VLLAGGWKVELLGVVLGGAPLLFLLELVLEVLALLGTLLEVLAAGLAGIHADEFNLLGEGVLWLLSGTALWNLLDGNALLSSLAGDDLMTLTGLFGLLAGILAASVLAGVTGVFPGVLFAGVPFAGAAFGGAPPPPLGRVGVAGG